METSRDEDWPSGVFSLAHVAIPFPPEDPLYGDGSGAIEGRLAIGAARIRTEKGVLTIPAEDLIRMRYNPFFDYVEQRTLEFVDGTDAGSTAQGISN